VSADASPGDLSTDFWLAMGLKPAFQSCDSAVAVENIFFTDSRKSATIVKIPRIVPKGMKTHSPHAIANANQ
jgi:hypothetical protein